jgi:hypothetical protein
LSELDEKTPPPPRWPWWEPYAFTAGLLVMVAVFLVVGGYLLPVVGGLLEPHGIGDYGFLVLSTLLVVYELFGKNTRVRSLAGCLLCTGFFALVSFSYFSLQELYLAAGFGVLTAACTGLSVKAVVVGRRLRAKQSEKLRQASETMRRVFRDDRK